MTQKTKKRCWTNFSCINLVTNYILSLLLLLLLSLLQPENILVMNDTDRPYIVISDFGHAISIKVDTKLNLDQKIYTQFFKNEGTLA